MKENKKLRIQAIKNLIMKNKDKLVTPTKIVDKIGKEVVEDNAEDILRKVAIERLRKKGFVISKDGAVANDGAGNIQAGSV